MDEKKPYPGAIALVVLALAPLVAAASDKVEVLPLVVRDGRCECVLPASRPDDKYFLIVGSLDLTASGHRVTVRTRSTDEPSHIPLHAAEDDPVWRRRLREQTERANRFRNRPAPPDFEQVAPPKSRTFFVFTGDQDFHAAESYTAIKADLRAVGRHYQVYLDQSHPRPADVQPTIDDVVRAFDREVFPKARETFGRAADVDRNGRFTILLSGCLDRLQNGKTSLGGFVRGGDFDRDLRAPFGNRCDMMYLNADLKPGAHLRTLLAHEYTHAVIFSEHGLIQDEESWLNEGLAHLAEDLHGFGWSNLDYRVSAFLSAPERYPLVVADYYRAGLWRTPGVRGACYLFARWCADRTGPELAARLTRSPLAGVANLEAATGERFADLFRGWTSSLLLSGTGMVDDTGVPPFRRIDPRRTLGERLLCGPRFEELAMRGGEQAVDLHGTSAAYFLLHSPGVGRCRLELTGPPAAELQATLVRLPAGMPRLSLRCEGSGRQVKLKATAHDGSAKLTEVAWERWTPTMVGEPATILLARDGFSHTELKPGEEAVSREMLAETTEPLVFKVGAVDGHGRRLAAWATLSSSEER